MLTAAQADALVRSLARSLDHALARIPDDTPPREVAVRLGWVAARVILGAVRVPAPLSRTASISTCAASEPG